jgi:hypothetical protein
MKTMTLSQHSLILDALAARDAVLARSAATIHVSKSERWLNEYLGVSMATETDGLLLEDEPAVLEAPST